MLQDLLFIDEGNPDTLHNLINFRKRGRMAGHLASFRQLVENEQYHFPIQRSLQSALHHLLPRLTDDELYVRSLEIEPRDAVKVL